MKHFNKLFILLAFIGMSIGSVSAQQTITLTNGQNYSNNIVMTGNTTITIASGTATISGVISDGYNYYTLTKAGAGTIILTAFNTYHGLTIVNAGKLQVGNGSTGSLGGNEYYEVQVNNNATLRFEPGYNMVFPKQIIGGGNVEFKGEPGKELRLTANNTYTGTTTIEGTNGMLYIGDNGGAGAIAGNITVNSGAHLCFYRSNDYTYSKVISGAGAVWQGGSGKTILTGNNAYTGITYVSHGTLQIGNGTSGSIDKTSGVEFLYADATLRFEPGADMTFSKVISGEGKVVYKGVADGYPEKMLSFTANNTYTGTTTIEQGTFQIGANTNSGAVAGDIILQSNESVLGFSRTDTYTYAKNITGKGGYVIFNRWIKEYDDYVTNGTIILTGNNTYTACTEVESGTLQIGNGTTSGSINNTSWVYVGYDATLRFEPGADMVFSKAINCWGEMEYKGSANKKLILTSDDGGSNSVTVEEGILQIGNGTSGYFDAGSVMLKSVTSVLRFEPGENRAFYGDISGAGKVEYKGSTEGATTKMLAFAGKSTYTGTTTIEYGTLHIGAFGTSGEMSGDIILQNKDSYLNFSWADTYTYAKDISGIGSVSVNRYYIGDGSWINTNGTVILTGNNTHTGETVVWSGDLQIGNGGGGSLTETSELYLYNTATLRFASGGNTVFPKVIAGSGNVVKSGSGALSATGAHTCIGAFTLESGSLEIAKWAGAFTQAANTTLNVKGDVSLGSNSGALTLQGGNINMNLTTSPPSKLTAVGALAASGTTTLHITSGNVSNQTIIQAASGLESATPFALDMTSGNASLVATGTELQLTVTGVGIDDYDVETGRATSVQVYPNPTNGQLRITNYELRITDVEIFDIYGRNVGFKFPSKNLEGWQPKADGVVFDISHLQAGIYFLKIHTENGVVTRKVVKE